MARFPRQRQRYCEYPTGQQFLGLDAELLDAIFLFQLCVSVLTTMLILSWLLHRWRKRGGETKEKDSGDYEVLKLKLDVLKDLYTKTFTVYNNSLPRLDALEVLMRNRGGNGQSGNDTLSRGGEESLCEWCQCSASPDSMSTFTTVSPISSSASSMPPLESDTCQMDEANHVSPVTPTSRPFSHEVVETTGGETGFYNPLLTGAHCKQTLEVNIHKTNVCRLWRRAILLVRIVILLLPERLRQKTSAERALTGAENLPHTEANNVSGSAHFSNSKTKVVWKKNTENFGGVEMKDKVSPSSKQVACSSEQPSTCRMEKESSSGTVSPISSSASSMPPLESDTCQMDEANHVSPATPTSRPFSHEVGETTGGETGFYNPLLTGAHCKQTLEVNIRKSNVCRLWRRAILLVRIVIMLLPERLRQKTSAERAFTGAENLPHTEANDVSGSAHFSNSKTKVVWEKNTENVGGVEMKDKVSPSSKQVACSSEQPSTCRMEKESSSGTVSPISSSASSMPPLESDTCQLDEANHVSPVTPTSRPFSHEVGETIGSETGFYNPLLTGAHCKQTLEVNIHKTNVCRLWRRAMLLVRIVIMLLPERLRQKTSAERAFTGAENLCHTEANNVSGSAHFSNSKTKVVWKKNTENVGGVEMKDKVSPSSKQVACSSEQPPTCGLEKECQSGGVPVHLPECQLKGTKQQSDMQGSVTVMLRSDSEQPPLGRTNSPSIDRVQISSSQPAPQGLRQVDEVVGDTVGTQVIFSQHTSPDHMTGDSQQIVAESSIQVCERVRTLAEGTFGMVWLLVARESKRTVVMKEMPCDERGANEVSVHKTLSHPNIVAFYAHRTVGETQQIFMQYCSRGNLSHLIVARVGMAENDARWFFRQLIAGVEYLHSVGITHRDITSENILLDADDNLKIADFGLATKFRDCGREICMTEMCGTGSHRAPEVWSRPVFKAPPVDVWACGIVLTEMLAGVLPWYRACSTSPAYSDWLKKKTHLVHWKEIAAPPLNLLTKILHHDPKKRITIHDIKKHRWYRQDFNSGAAVKRREKEEKKLKKELKKIQQQEEKRRKEKERTREKREKREKKERKEKIEAGKKTGKTKIFRFGGKKNEMEPVDKSKKICI